MATYPATRPASYKRHDQGSGAGVWILALFLGLAVGVLVIVSAVLVKMADDARDDAATATSATTHDHSTQGSSAVSLPIQSFAGVTGKNAEELAKAHVATKATLPPVPAGELDAKVDAVVENLARKLPQTTRYAKQHLNFWRDLAWHETINHARDWLALSMATDEPKAAIEKFLDRK